jgi:hypothetical protein
VEITVRVLPLLTATKLPEEEEEEEEEEVSERPQNRETTVSTKKEKVDTALRVSKQCPLVLLVT